jgi:hypothetical protein
VLTSLFRSIKPHRFITGGLEAIVERKVCTCKNVKKVAMSAVHLSSTLSMSGFIQETCWDHDSI